MSEHNPGKFMTGSFTITVRNVCSQKNTEKKTTNNLLWLGDYLDTICCVFANIKVRQIVEPHQSAVLVVSSSPVQIILARLGIA